MVENEGGYAPGGPSNRPFYPSAPYPPSNRPLFTPAQPRFVKIIRPIISRILLDLRRPGGGYGQGFRPGVNPGILTGPIPSWEQQRPHLLNFDKCKCAEKFNCNSPGISYVSFGYTYVGTFSRVR